MSNSTRPKGRRLCCAHCGYLKYYRSTDPTPYGLVCPGCRFGRLDPKARPWLG